MVNFLCLGIDLQKFKNGFFFNEVNAYYFFELARELAKNETVQLYIEGVENTCDNQFVTFIDLSVVKEGFFNGKEVFLYADLPKIHRLKNCFIGCEIKIITPKDKNPSSIDLDEILNGNTIKYISFNNILPEGISENETAKYQNILTFNKNPFSLMDQIKDPLFVSRGAVRKLSFAVDVASLNPVKNVIKSIKSNLNSCEITIFAEGPCLSCIQNEFREENINVFDLEKIKIDDLLWEIYRTDLFVFSGIGNRKNHELLDFVYQSGIPWIATISVVKTLGLMPTFILWSNYFGEIKNSLQETISNVFGFLRDPTSRIFQTWISYLKDKCQKMEKEKLIAAKRLQRPESKKDLCNGLHGKALEINKEKEYAAVVWLGRFDFVGGYGAVARGYMDAMEAAGIRCLLIDINKLKPVGKADGIFWEHDASDRKYVIRNPSLLVINDIPTKYQKFSATGFLSRIGCTLFETDSFPVDWVEGLKYIDQIWVPTQFNYNTFSNAGIPKSRMSVIGYSINTDYYAPVKKKDDGIIKLLYIVSNLNRKDPGLLIRSYFSIFSKDDNVMLTIKTRMSEHNFIEAMRPHVEPKFSFENKRNPSLRIVTGTLSDDLMRNLYAESDLYVTTERAKGWDYPAMEAMSMGIPTIALNWSGSEFLNDENAFLVPVKDNLVRVHSSQVDNAEMYFGHKWADVDEAEVGKMIRMAVKSEDMRLKKGRKCRMDALKYHPKQIGNEIIQLIHSQKYSSTGRNAVLRY